MSRSDVPIYFKAVLRPNPPLPRNVLYCLLAVVTVTNLFFVVMFALRGAWPAFPFMGVDMLYFVWAFSSNSRRQNIAKKCCSPNRLCTWTSIRRAASHRMPNSILTGLVLTLKNRYRAALRSRWQAMAGVCRLAPFFFRRATVCARPSVAISARQCTRLSDAEHVHHRIKARRPVATPFCSRNSAPRENCSIFRDMFQDYALMRACKDDLVIADDGPTAKRRYPYGGVVPRGRAAAVAQMRGVQTVRRRGRTTEHKRGARRCILFCPVMHFNDLYVKAL
jgi:hypothetical protein